MLFACHCKQLAWSKSSLMLPGRLVCVRSHLMQMGMNIETAEMAAHEVEQHLAA